MTRTVQLTTDERQTLAKAQRVISRLTHRIDDLICDDRLDCKPRWDSRTGRRIASMQNDLNFITCTTI
jgi:hypothetical protein